MDLLKVMIFFEKVSCVKNELLPSHPLELSEKNYQLNQDKMNFSTLRNIQGLFASLKLQMEFKAGQQVKCLPFLPSSNLSLDILRGNDETIGFEDILNGKCHSTPFSGAPVIYKATAANETYYVFVIV